MSLLAVTDLTVTFPTDAELVTAVRGMNFDVNLGEVVALVGESGAGKSASAMAVVGLLPEYAEVAAYYVLAEALTNAAKHAQATEVLVSCEVDGANLCLRIRDDGVGGADLARGSGLLGLKDRVEAAGGQLQIASIAGRGTSLSATIPLAD